jgi:tetratricopeptide (TPR) repeat protein
MLALARRMMHGAKAKLVAAYLDTLQATIMMSKSAEATCIREALSLLRGAYSTLTSEGSCRHIHYALRCRNEIALAYLRLARTFTVDQAQREENLIKAERAVAAVKASATKLPKTEHKTYCVALITEARIRRERGEHAEAIARAKEAKTFGANLDAVQVDALISIGEAELGRRKYGNAVSAFLDALKKSKDHRKDAAVCYVHLCRAYLLDGQPGKAKEMFDRWESIGAGLENAFITNLAATDEQMLSKVLEDFLRTKDDIKHLGKAALHLKALRHWLAVTALALESDNFKLASERLGIGVGTLDVWLKLKVTDL